MGLPFSYPVVSADYFTTRLAHDHIESHHQHETDGKADSAEIGMLTTGDFGDEFLNHDVEHDTSCKGSHVRKKEITRSNNP